MVSEIVIGGAPMGVGFTLGGIARSDAQVALTGRMESGTFHPRVERERGAG